MSASPSEDTWINKSATHDLFQRRGIPLGRTLFRERWQPLLPFRPIPPVPVGASARRFVKRSEAERLIEAVHADEVGPLLKEWTDEFGPWYEKRIDGHRELA